MANRVDLSTGPQQIEQALEDIVKRLKNAPPATSGEAADEVDMLSIEANVRARKGSWWQIPKHLAEKHENMRPAR
jgi:hypothetical protein